MDEITLKDYAVTCTTNGCMNSGIPITLSAPEVNHMFICGPCGQTIVNVVALA